MEDDPTLPGNAQIIVSFLVIKELVHKFRDSLLHILIQYHVIPTGRLDLLVQVLTLHPPPIIHVHEFVIRYRGLPLPNRFDQSVRRAITGHRALSFRRLFQDILVVRQANLDDIDDVEFATPAIEVLGESAAFGEPTWSAAARVVVDVVADALNRLIFDVELRCGIASSGEL